MRLNGTVLAMKDGSFSTKKGERVQQLKVDVYDQTCGLVNCTMPASGPQVVAGSRIGADIVSIRKNAFNPTGVEFGLGNIQEVGEMPAPSIPPVAPLGRK
jgi:hypothetical protein